MTEPIKKPGATEETTILHMNKFVPGPGPAASEAGADDSPTMFFVKAAAETCEQSSKPVVNPKDAAALPPKAMLGIVSYCYAKGVYSSQDIERKMERDETLRAACADGVPSDNAIRRFRRLNRDAIQATLEKFFRRTRKRKVLTEVLPGATPPVPTPPPPTADTPDGENTQMFVKKEASDRLDKASFVDGMSRTD